MKQTTASDRAKYLEQVLVQLRGIADGPEFTMLAHLIDMAAMEARLVRDALRSRA